MKKLLAFLLIAFSASALGQIIQLHDTVDAATGRHEHTVYVVFTPTTSSQELTIPYASLVAEGVTDPLHISFAQGDLSPDSNGVYAGGANVLIESAASSSTWKPPLIRLRDVSPVREHSFSPGVILSPGDDLCISVWSGSSATAHQVQFGMIYQAGP